MGLTIDLRIKNLDAGIPLFFLLNVKLGELNTTHQLSNVMNNVMQGQVTFTCLWFAIGILKRVWALHEGFITPATFGSIC